MAMAIGRLTVNIGGPSECQRRIYTKRRSVGRAMGLCLDADDYGGSSNLIS